MHYLDLGRTVPQIEARRCQHRWHTVRDRAETEALEVRDIALEGS